MEHSTKQKVFRRLFITDKDKIQPTETSDEFTAILPDPIMKAKTLSIMDIQIPNTQPTFKTTNASFYLQYLPAVPPAVDSYWRLDINITKVYSSVSDIVADLTNSLVTQQIQYVSTIPPIIIPPASISNCTFTYSSDTGKISFNDNNGVPEWALINRYNAVLNPLPVPAPLFVNWAEERLGFFDNNPVAPAPVAVAEANFVFDIRATPCYYITTNMGSSDAILVYGRRPILAKIPVYTTPFDINSYQPASTDEDMKLGGLDTITEARFTIYDWEFERSLLRGGRVSYALSFKK